MRCLIVEDDKSSRKLILRYLEEYFDCDIAEDGLHGVDAFEKALKDGNPYDLICMDIMMPEMNGHQALEKIRKIEEEKGINCLDGVKVVMTTAMDDSKTIMTSFRKGCEGYVLKPIKISKLFDQLHQLNVLDTSIDWLSN